MVKRRTVKRHRSLRTLFPAFLSAILAALAIVLSWTAFGIWGASTVVAAVMGAAVMRYGHSSRSQTNPRHSRPGTAAREMFINQIDQHLEKPDRENIVMLIEIDHFRQLKECHDHAAIERLLTLYERRIKSEMRDSDQFSALVPPMFGVLVDASGGASLEDALQLASRLQRAISEPISLSGASIRITASVGFCLSERLTDATSEVLLQAATNALNHAQRNGPSAVRSYSEAIEARRDTARVLTSEVERALQKHEIQPFFQPQICAQTRVFTGLETLARWDHPDRGFISPATFLPAFQNASKMCELGQHMLNEGLRALAQWDQIGVAVPMVAVNFSTDELSDDQLINRVKSTLSAHAIAPDRLAIEVLESVVADESASLIISNLAALATMGCNIDLDDFGTGHASITSIRKFSIERIKIDRSFISGIDSDKDQQDMVAAILTMADRLGVSALAEGVETSAEDRTLCDLGVAHLQGFGIARPMPFDETTHWVETYRQGSVTPLLLHEALTKHDQDQDVSRKQA